MTNKTKGLMAFTTILLTAACAFGGGLSLNLGDQPKTGSIVDVTYDGVRLKYTLNATIRGAYLYGDGSVFVDYKLEITSTKPIVKIQFEGKRSTSSGRTADIKVTPSGTNFTFSETGTSVWEGSSTSIKFVGASSSTGYIIQTIRILREGEKEDDGQEVDVLKKPGKDIHYYSQGRNLPYDGKPVTLAVVSDSKFKDALQDYLVWKTQQGYHVVEFYADEISDKTKKTNDALALEIRERIMKLDPRPSYVLLAGDSAEVPYFEPRTAMAGGQAAVTDFFYGEYTGDHFPEAAVGRFSANTVEQLQAQMDKTKHMALIKPENAGWLANSLVVHSPASDIKTEKSVEFACEFPKAWEGNVAHLIETSSKWQQINTRIKDGCSFVTYLGHGGSTMWFDSWNNSNYTINHAEQLANQDRYPVVLGLTCLSGSFQLWNSLAEAFMRKAKGGAVVYIGATRESWDGADNLFFRGGSANYECFERAGLMRSLFHPDPEEDTSQLTRTIGDAFNIGKYSCRFIGEYSPFRQFMEFFTLFGDPTYQPYITTPEQMTIDAPASVAAGHRFSVKTAPDAVVCISKGREIVAVGLANEKGEISLKIPLATTPDTYTLYSSAPFYNDYFKDIRITAADGVEDADDRLAKTPRVEYKDVINVETAAKVLPGNTKEYLGYLPSPIGFSSPARYTMWAGSNLTAGANDTQYQHWLTEPNDTMRAIYLRNKYDRSGFITTTSGGKAAYVEVEWLHPIGQAEILGVYGSNTPYTDTQAANQNPGTKLGEIRKGNGNRLDITGDWKYLMIRAEDYEGYFERPSSDQNDVFIKSLTIGWNLLAEETSVTPGTTIEVTATSATEAEELGEIVLADTAAERAGQKKVLKLVATKVTNGKWTLSVEIAPELMEKGHKIDDTVAALGEALSKLAVASKTRGATMSLEIPAESVTPGLYYSVRYASSPDFKTSAESPRTLAKPGKDLVLELPVDNAPSRFFKVKASMTQHWD